MDKSYKYDTEWKKKVTKYTVLIPFIENKIQ